MKVILIVAPWEFEKQYAGKLHKVGAIQPPLGLALLAACLEKENIDVEIIDCIVDKITNEKLLEILSEKKPDIVGFSCLTPAVDRVKVTSKLVKEKFPDIKIIVGGHHPSSLPLRTFKYLEHADVLCVGEGDHAIVEIVKAIENGSGLSKIKGIVFKDKEIIQTSPRDINKEVDSLPYPARHLLPMHKYEGTPANYKRQPQLAMVTSFGCPYQCVYCSNHVFSKKYRAMTPKRVVEEMKFLIKEYGAKEIHFWDAEFTLNKQRVLDLCDLIIKEKLNISWTCMSRVDAFTEEMAFKLKKAGCWQVGFGVESGNPDVIKMIKKNITLEQADNAFKWARKAGLKVRSYWMIGLPGDTQKTIMDTINMSIKLKPDIAQYCITTPYPGTELYDIAKKEGSLVSEDWSNYTMISEQPSYVPPGLTQKELVDYMKLAYKKFYMRPSFLLRKVLEIRSLTDIKNYIRAFVAVRG